MVIHRSTILATLLLISTFSLPVNAENTGDYSKDKEWDQLTPAEHTAAKATARNKTVDVLRVCADPGNMPLSNNRREGFQNKIAEVLAEAMGGKATFFWRPYLERGLTRETFDNNECDVLMDMPAAYTSVLTTNPIYRTTYVLAYRDNSGIAIRSLDDEKLKELKVGVFQHSGMREVLARHGVKNNVEIHVISQNADLVPENQPWRQVQKVIDGKLDIAGVWGPFAGWLKTMKGAPLTLQPVNVMEDRVPLEFDLAIGMRKNNVVLKYMLDNALEARRAEIAKILAEYGVPLIKCSRCVVEGDLPSHGSYFERFLADAQKRYLAPSEPAPAPSKDASPDQVVTQARLEDWLAQGADLAEELNHAALASDHERVTFLLGKGADPNAPNREGSAPLHTAAKDRDSAMIALLLEHKASPNVRDRHGWTPLLYAAYRNHVPSVKALAAGGADLETPTPGGYTPLAIAIDEGQFFAARTLIDVGANVNAPVGKEGVTPLMLTATKKGAQKRDTWIAQGPSPMLLAEELIARGADVNARTKAGISALMIAAGHNNAPMVGLLARSGADPLATSAQGKTALDIATQALNHEAIGALRLLTPPTAQN